MGITLIEWAKYTHNEWIGCEKVSQECKNCYAESWAKRWLSEQKLWGPESVRHRTSEANRKKPYKWDSDAGLASTKDFVFSNSMSDWAEQRLDLQEWREELFDKILVTPNLIWLMLTKRYEFALQFLHWREIRGVLPKNMMLGFTAGTKETANEVVSAIDRAKAAFSMPNVRIFLSCEPLLENIVEEIAPLINEVEWIIVGGESGAPAKARPTHPAWARRLRDFCHESGTLFFFKQWGNWMPYEEAAQPPFWKDMFNQEYDGHALEFFDAITGDVGKGWYKDDMYGLEEFMNGELMVQWKYAQDKKENGNLLDGSKYLQQPIFL